MIWEAIVFVSLIIIPNHHAHNGHPIRTLGLALPHLLQAIAHR
jgi:hypothetical protein